MPQINRMTITLALSVFLLFLLLTFDERMAMIFSLMLFAYYIWWQLDPKPIDFPIERDDKGRLKSLFITIMFYAGFLLIVTVITSAFASIGFIVVEAVSTGSILELLGTTTPALADNKVLTFIGWAIIIPIIETAFFFMILLEGMAYRVGKYLSIGPISTKFNPSNPLLWGVILAISALFTLFHLTAKGMHNSAALMITFIFAMVSCWMVVYFRRGREAIIFHMISNAMAVASNFGYI